MKQLLILSTIVLLFVFANQIILVPKNYTKIFNHSRLFNVTVCRPGYFRNKNGQCIKKALHEGKDRFKLKNYTHCPYTQKLSCFKSRVTQKTYCVCLNSTNTTYVRRTINRTRLTCPEGTIRRCNSRLRRRHRCYCKPIPNYIQTNNSYTCPTGTLLKCYKESGNIKCHCQKDIATSIKVPVIHPKH